MMTWQAAWLLFDQSLALKVRQPKTCLAYRHDIIRLEQCSSANSPVLMNEADIQQIMLQLRKTLSSKSLGRMLSAWRGFFACLVDHGYISVNCCATIRVPRGGKRLPKALPVDMTQRLLDQPQLSDRLYIRDRAIFELMYSSGLRLSEVVMLDIMHVDLVERLVRVVGKGNKERLLPIGRQAVNAIEQYLPRRTAKIQETALFTNQAGYRLGQRQIQYRLARWSQLAGLAQHVSPHMLRHSFASHFLQSSGDLRAVQEMLGHVNLSSTQIYTRLDYQHLSQTYDLTHPRARLQKKHRQ